MNCEIITVGSEITAGDITNTNAAFLSEELTNLGIEVNYQTAVDDNAGRIIEALRAAVSRSHIIIFTGGLGPTADDITKETVFKAVGLELSENEQSLERIKRYFAAKGEQMPAANIKQAMFPKNARIFENGCGTADGCAVRSGTQCLVLLPGPPRELRPMFAQVAEYLTDFLDLKSVVKNLKVFGPGESGITEAISDIIERKRPTVATYIEAGGDVRIKITASGKDENELNALCDKTAGEIEDRLKSAVYSDRGLDLQSVVVENLRVRNLKIATAESCTAGLLSKMLTDVSGSSQVFEYGISAYANRIKNEKLGVSNDLLRRVGAVSPEVADAMAKGAKTEGRADIGIGITGLAGPDGGTDKKPVGLVFVSLFDGKDFYTKQLNIPSSKGREEIRLRSAMEALNMVRLYIFKDADFLSTKKAYNDPSRDVFSGAVKPFVSRQNQGGGAAGATTFGGVNPSDRAFSKENIFKDMQEKSEQKGKEQNSRMAAKNTSKSGTAKAAQGKKRKKKSAADKVRKVILVLCVIIFAASATYIGDYVYQSIKNRNEVDRINSLFSQNGLLDKNGINTSFYELLNENPETVGWLNVPNTQTHNPVVKTTDNDKYLTTNFEGESSRYGAIFADMNNTFAKGPLLSTNTILYGHHMRDGQMMGELKKYRELDFYKENPVVEFTTIYSPKVTRWKVFSVFVINADPSDDNGNVFNYMKNEFSTQSEFNEFLQNCYQRSIITTPVQDVTESDKILTLSTCIYDFNNARLVVVARMVRDGESESVDTSSAVYNPDPVYPQAYRNRYGAGRTTVELAVKPSALYKAYEKGAALLDNRHMPAHLKKSFVF